MSVATTAVHLYAGLEDERLRQEIKSYPNEGSGGFSELVADIADYAEALEEVWEAEQRTDDFPTVYDYEVTQPMGAWLYHNFYAGKRAFTEELRRGFNKCMGMK